MNILLSLLAVFIYSSHAAPKYKKPIESIDDNVCGGIPAELFFLVDASSSIWPVYFMKQLQFVRDVIETFEISPNKTRVGLATFSDRYHPHIALDTFDTKENLQTAVDQVRQEGGGTYTHLAIEGMRTRGFDKRVVRQGVVQIAVVMTDGQSINMKETAKEAQKLKDEGVVILSVGIGDKVNQQELRAIASAEKYLFQVASFDLLDTIKKTVSFKVCEAELGPQMDQPACGATNPADIMFVMDSAALGSEKTAKIHNFLSDLTPDFNMDSGNIRVGVESRNCAENDIRLADYSDKSELAKALRNIEFANLGHMIKKMRTHSFQEENGGRDTARHMAVIFVDNKLGENAKEIFLEAHKAHKDDIELFVFAIGDSVIDEELQMLCSHPVDTHIIRVNSYEELPVFKEDFINTLCNGL
ncbi:hypothetical protein CHS0354_013452 [Potamilus streckersoni]|uniref:VWFA domain-containing protein n=1 Tax=Potamilus streckersoni TaxID=2493646 RepID=A0AAE0VKX0_9BIVA|nr:hypothetical protein CHS0354_013452 [Potamilus streckersoni]